jgi:predicted TIM-barrel fold metal-dependent hydrolase
MDVMANEFHVDAWKLYPQWGPEGVGFFMDDPRYGIPMLERARKLGVKIVCAHRGLPLPNLAYEYSRPEDIVRVGRMFPDLTFLCYHSGFEPGVKEGPYDPKRDKGVDRFIKAYLEHGYQPNKGNVYAELGSCWRHYMSKPDQAAHLMGKLLKYFGEDRICWGTDSIWYGSPQDQIQTFRTFTITQEFREKYGYPALTSEAKRKIFGLNAARLHGIDIEKVKEANDNDRVGMLRNSYGEQRNPSFQTYGPKTQAAFDAFLLRQRGFPG